MATQIQTNTANVIDSTLLAEAQLSYANEPRDAILDIAHNFSSMNEAGGHTVTVPILNNLTVTATSDGALAAAQNFTITNVALTIDKFLSGRYSQTWRSAIFQNQKLGMYAIVEFLKAIDKAIATELHALYASAGLGVDASSTQLIDDTDIRNMRLKMRKAKHYGGIFSFVHHDNEDAMLGTTKYENAETMGSTEAVRNGFIKRVRGIDFFTTHLAATSTGSSQQLFGAITSNPLDAPLAWMAKPIEDGNPHVILNLPEKGARIREFWTQAGTRDLIVDLNFGVKSIRPGLLGVFESKPAA
ncbi:MAG: hypothetical protein KDB07_13200 [Planctomycetes bacterium]|nr:hypothetical protein [Planctomycetota bacterium]